MLCVGPCVKGLTCISSLSSQPADKEMLCFFPFLEIKKILAAWRHQVTAKVLQLICCGLGLLTQPRIFITLLSPKFPVIKKIKAEHIRLCLLRQSDQENGTILEEYGICKLLHWPCMSLGPGALSAIYPSSSLRSLWLLGSCQP